MFFKRRAFINYSLVAGAGMITGLSSFRARREEQPATWLSPVINDVQPITVQEREARIAKAQRLMADNEIEAILLDAGTTMTYFTGLRWWPSERTLAVIIPAKGKVKYISPAFEEDRLRELITIGGDVYVWQEDESPYQLIATTLKDLGIRSGKIGIEERLRFFILDGVRKEALHLEYTSADPVTVQCRLVKSPAEIALMQKASDITVAAIKAGISVLNEGVGPSTVANAVAEVHEKSGASHDFALVLFGEASALPHGSTKPQKLKKGDVVLMDCGCSVHGYSSDITRTVVFGAEPTKRQVEIWNLEKASQAAGFAAVKPGSPCEQVDAAARKVLTDAGFGPGYQLPGLPHRTGHGIGMDGHEWGNMVKGNKQSLQPGMCFSIEPTISIPGEFGMRLEDCVYITEEGAKWFSQPSPSIKEPFV